MRRCVWLVGALCVASGCGGEEDAQDAGIDAAPTYAIVGLDATVTANVLLDRVLTITGAPGDEVVVMLDRASAGTLSSATLTLDGAGTGTVIYTPCSGYTAGCTGPASVSLALVDSSDDVKASAAFTLAVSADVGEIAPCQTNDNVLYLRGNDHVFTGTFQSNTAGFYGWAITTSPDRVTVTVGSPPEHYVGTFSLEQLLQPIAPGTYTDVERASFATEGHPGLEVQALGAGCNTIGGRFQVHDYTADPVHGTVESLTVSFEQLCDQVEDQPVRMLQGCFHYQASPAPPVTPPPAPDPTKVAVRVLSTSFNGLADSTALAIFTDGSGNVVLDTQVDAFGMAQATLPNGGAVTTIQFASNYEIIHTYRGVGTGDYIVVNAAQPTGGEKDLMFASYTLPANATDVALLRACSGGSRTKPGLMTLEFADGCRTSTFGVLALATMPTGPQQFVWNPSLPHLANGNVALGTSWAPMGAASVTLANVPSNLWSVSVEWATKIDGTPLQMSTAGISNPAAGTHMLSLGYAPGAGHGTVVTVGIPSPSDLTYESRTIVDTGSPSAINVDFTSQALPIPSAIQQTNTGATWTQTTGTADVRRLIWQAMTATHRVRWYLAEPNDGQASTTLSLPASHAAQDPTQYAGLQLYGSSVFYDDYDTVTGFTLAPPAGGYRAHAASASTYNMRFPF